MVLLRLHQLYCCVICFLLIYFCNCLQYVAIKEAKASCFPKDSCNIPRDVDSLEDYNCDCGSECGLYKTCCIDSPFLNRTKHLYKRTVCRTVAESSISIFMVDTCSPAYNGPSEIRTQCEEEILNWEDPLVNAPITNPKSAITYKSLFCAICNFENPKDLTMWQLMLDCTALGEFMHVCTKNRNFVLDNIMYIKDKGSWGLWSWDKNSDWKFRFLPITFKQPDELKNSIQHCRPDLISFCPEDWKDIRTKRYCESYMAAVYFPYHAFRNIHCAICHKVRNFTEMSCRPVYSSSFRKSITLSFGLLLDISLKDGDKVGSTNICTKGQIYDPFAKKCRTVECPLAGYKLKDEYCVHE